MNIATLCFPINDRTNEILLGMKKRGFGEGRYNGFGGRQEKEETIEETAIRELSEETAGVKTTLEDLTKVAELTFTFPSKKEWDHFVHVYLVKKWTGEPAETEEMRPQWFKIEEIPYTSMWADDKYWLPPILQGKKLCAYFVFAEDQTSILEHLMTLVSGFY